MDTPPNSELFKAIVTIIPVVSGALIGILGALVGNRYTHKLNTNSSRLAEKRSKLELLVTESFEILVWLRKQEGYYFYGGDEIVEQSPMAKIEALTAIYFEELDERVQALSEAESNYRLFLLTGSKLRLDQKLKVLPKEHLDKIGGVYGRLIKEQDAVVKAARKLMNKLSAP